MKVLTVAVFSALAVVSSASFAAKPRTISFDADHQAANGTAYATYTVKCSDGKEKELTSWSDQRKWCVGDDSSEQCEKKQIRAALKACKAG